MRYAGFMRVVRVSRAGARALELTPMANDKALAPSTGPNERLAEVPRAGAMPQLRYLFRSMRPRQWTKNGIVFLALIFSVGQEYHLSDA